MVVCFFLNLKNGLFTSRVALFPSFLQSFSLVHQQATGQAADVDMDSAFAATPMNFKPVMATVR